MMETSRLISAMKTSISEILETMFFLPLDFSDKDPLDGLRELENEGVLSTRLNFNGPFTGHFDFFIPEKLARSLAASFLGKDEDDISSDVISQTVKEVVNMIAGNTFHCFDDQAVFDLDIPKLGPFYEEEISPDEEAISLIVNTLDDRMGVSLVQRRVDV